MQLPFETFCSFCNANKNDRMALFSRDENEVSICNQCLMNTFKEALRALYLKLQTEQIDDRTKET